MRFLDRLLGRRRSVPADVAEPTTEATGVTEHDTEGVVGPEQGGPEQGSEASQGPPEPPTGAAV